MPVTLTIFEGRPAIEVEDSRGRKALYWFRLLGDVLELISTIEPDHRSLVRSMSNGSLGCDCKGWQFKKDRSVGCKHIEAAKKLLPLLESVGV